MPSPKEYAFNAIVDYGLAVRNLCAAIGASGLHEYFNGGSLLAELVEKLPPSMKLSWYYHRRRHSAPTSVAFNEWMRELVSAAWHGVTPVVSSENSSKDDRSSRRPPQAGSDSRRKDHHQGRTYANVNVHTTQNPRSSDHAPHQTCPACAGECEQMASCSKFLKMNTRSRWDVVKSHNLCRTCLRTHQTRCQAPAACEIGGCKRRHHKLLHNGGNAAAQPGAANPESTVSCNTHSGPPNEALLKYVPVTLHANGKKVNTMALLDDGSTSTFVEHALLSELGVSGKPRPLCVAWTEEQQRYERNSVELPLQISGQQHDAKIFTMSAVHTL
ncbi:uncharacterized protein LOC128270460 [Anopheles cruzii]|uniref:uncharacterized protein LOC128270460 n=1 Tax=Anopheles cruzii TaxID=68878 RepID=UPI0022EC5829|nr:uncharacterized protein LOC128270460 [Anopheles cruzii]